MNPWEWHLKPQWTWELQQSYRPNGVPSIPPPFVSMLAGPAARLRNIWQRESPPILWYTNFKASIEQAFPYRSMYRVFILTDRDAETSAIPWAVDGEEVSYVAGTAVKLEGSWNGDQSARPTAVLLDLDTFSNETARIMASRCQEHGLPVVAVVSGDRLRNYDPSINVDDFILRSFSPEELLVRLDRVISRTTGPDQQNLITSGDLLLDPDHYDVSLAGKKVLLTYKEYQLLVLLASNPGKVYTRGSLLNQVWGYDYFGGTRTVDVHIRRLRSKIENASHSYIETIRNVGYRFKTSQRTEGHS